MKGYLAKVFAGWKLGGDGRYVHISRLIDRENNRYTERVVDEHGNVEVDKDHPLTEHHKHHGKRIER